MGNAGYEASTATVDVSVANSQFVLSAITQGTSRGVILAEAHVPTRLHPRTWAHADVQRVDTVRFGIGPDMAGEHVTPPSASDAARGSATANDTN